LVSVTPLILQEWQAWRAEKERQWAEKMAHEEERLRRQEELERERWERERVEEKQRLELEREIAREKEIANLRQEVESQKLQLQKHTQLATTGILILERLSLPPDIQAACLKKSTQQQES
jgi:hypothetical protein